MTGTLGTLIVLPIFHMNNIQRGLAVAASFAFANVASAQLNIVSNLPGSFIDISTTGTPLSLGDDAEVDIVTTIGNTVLPAGIVRVGSNGGVRFAGAGLDLSAGNASIPATGAFSGGQSLLAFWDDINTVGGTVGEIYWQETQGQLIVQWEDVGFFGTANVGQTTTFQLQVPSTGTTWARFVYQDVSSVRANGGESATIGYQAGGVGNDVEFSFNTAGAVADNTVLSLVGVIVPPPPASCRIVSNIPGTWIDISTTGTPLSLADDGEADITTTIGNSVFPAGTARVGSNGGVRFAGTGTDLGFTNLNLPSGAAFSLTSQVLLPFWDDMNTVSGTVGEIYWQETQGRLIVQWQAAGFFNAPGEVATYQIQVPAAGGSVKAQFLYQDVQGIRADGGGSATIGYQAGNGPADFVEFSFNTPGAVSNGTVLSLVPDVLGSNFCSANPNSTGAAASISAVGSAVAADNDLTLQAASLPPGQFGIFVTSTTTTAGSPVGAGILCLGGQLGRYNLPGQILQANPAGEFSLALNLTQTPLPSAFTSVMAGETRSWQAWYRDFTSGGMSTSNFTNGITITFN